MAWLKRAGSIVTDLFFPPHCVICRSPGSWLCATCLERIEVIRSPVCPRCGLPLDQEIAKRAKSPVCRHCHRQGFPLAGARAFAFHADPLRQAIHEFKYNDMRCLAVPLARLLAQGWAELAPSHLTFDVIIPVPLHAHRERERGYNQAALLAGELGRCLHLPVVERVLVRCRATAPQIDLPPAQRRANVQGAFQCASGTLAARRVLLIDDVYTTGSTLESASAALYQAGVSLVWAYTLTRARPKVLQ
jgi:ComF family protein